MGHDRGAVMQLLRWDTREVERGGAELRLGRTDYKISVALKLNMPGPQNRVIWKQGDSLRRDETMLRVPRGEAYPCDRTRFIFYFSSQTLRITKHATRKVGEFTALRLQVRKLETLCRALFLITHW